MLVWATLMPSTLGLIRNMFRDPRQMGLAITLWVSCFMGGATIGPLVGGVLLSHFWWGSAFLLGAPVMVPLLVLGPLLLPSSATLRPVSRIVASVALSLATILPIIYGLKELAKSGSSPLSIAAIVIGVAFGAVFLRRQRKLSAPLLDLRLFGNRSFSTALGIGLFGGVVMGGIYLFVTLYFQMVEGLSPLRAGLWLVPQALAPLDRGSILAPRLARWIRPAYVMAAGLPVLTRVDSADGLAVLVIGFVITSLGLALPMALGTGLVLGSAPPEKAGSAAAMSETGGEFGIALGVATLGSLGTAVYHTQIADAISSGVPVAAASSARESIIGATAAAAHLPGQLGAALLTPAREAFTNGLNATAGIGAMLFIGLAILVATQLRHVRPFGEVEAEAAQVTLQESLQR